MVTMSQKSSVPQPPISVSQALMPDTTPWIPFTVLGCLSGLNVMPKYLAEGRYTAAGAKGLAHEGGSRRPADIAKTVESAGGKLESVYFAFGDADFFIIFDAPDNISAAALSVAANQSDFVTSKLVVLITPDEMDQAIKKATTVEYLPPGH
jgi:uncharacterized protein with GYD domain